MPTVSRFHAAPPALLTVLVSCLTAFAGVASAADYGDAESVDVASKAAPETSEDAVHFAFDDDRMLRAAEIKIAWLVAAAQGPMGRVQIEGYADSTGSERYNTDLSLRRARSVRDFLVDELGIERSTLSLVAYGEAYPAESNDTDEGRAANRRVEFHRVVPAQADAGS